jgi:protein-L-isoaspartate(D-aspartate) O-methyltransferase
MDPAVLREDMVDGVHHALGGLDGTVAAAMRTVPRHEFVHDRPYDNRESDADGSRVLSPTTVARLMEALAVSDGDRDPADAHGATRARARPAATESDGPTRPDGSPAESVLVVGAGVGYTAAVLAEMVGPRRVHAIDITRRFVVEARRNLARAGYDAVLVDCRDGAEGLPEYAPYDRVLVEAAAVRPPRRLLTQVAPAGRLVMPLGGPDQTLVALEPDGRDEFEVIDRYGPVGFDPLLVEGEQRGGPARNRTEREDREFAEQGHFARTGWEYEWIDWDDRLDSGRGHRRRTR